jgi:hypothetical protein
MGLRQLALERFVSNRLPLVRAQEVPHGKVALLMRAARLTDVQMV